MKSQNKQANTLTRIAYESCKKKFNTAFEAKRYSTKHITSKKGLRERACIKQALIGVEKNALILDLPCGTGRLSYFINYLGYEVIGADYSNHMLKYAKKNVKNLPNTNNKISFEQQDVMAIRYKNNTFAAALCNRLFHHFPTADLRRKALKELARVTNGPIIVSFFNSYSLSAVLTKLKNVIKNKKPYDRVAISFHTFKKDIEASGLKIISTYYTKFGISPQTYVKLIKQT